ncbi:MAG: hypothetical protein HC910_21515 [Spirulinaceae cyanobacterium SM2_1_0]|nr:hypothetical protein [Spirulinaceae cyanobacterium SM2_1_0]
MIAPSVSKGTGSIFVPVDPDYILVKEAINGAGGSFVSGAWRQRAFNSKTFDDGNHTTLDSNQIILSPGIYRFAGSAPAFLCERHQVRLQNISANQTVAMGTSELATASGVVQGRSFVSGQIAAIEPVIVELQHKCTQTRANDGFGNPSLNGLDVYSVIEFWWRPLPT